MIELVVAQMAPLLLMGGYFLNGGVGLMLQPSAGSQGSAPATHAILTESGVPITTESGVIIRTEQ